MMPRHPGRSSRSWLNGSIVCLSTIAPILASAQQQTPVTGFLVDRVNQVGTYDSLERRAANANQFVYNALVSDCANGGCASNPRRQQIFDEVQELVETAQELQTGQQAANSLDLDDEGLAAALRWTAAEEVSAQGRVAGEFANGQVANATNRITALRFGAKGFNVAGLPGLPTDPSLGVEARSALGPAGPAPQALSKWGGFLNATYGWGEHDPTTFEDAFDVESIELTAGVDYRFHPQFVGGLLVGYTDNSLDFDASQSIVDGGIDSRGFSLGTFGLYSWKDFYLSGFFSYQRLEFDIDRFITYPSLNPFVDGANTRATGDTVSNAFTGAANLGYTFRFGPGTSKPFLFEPYFRTEYTNTQIDDFNESNTSASESFALAIDDQGIESLELAFGLRLSAAISTRIGVFFPYVRHEWRIETQKSARSTSSQYKDIGPISGAAANQNTPFILKGERIDTSYGNVSVGLQTIVLGGGQRELGGPIAGRLSVFGEYRTVYALEHITNHLLTGGARYAF